MKSSAKLDSGFEFGILSLEVFERTGKRHVHLVLRSEDLHVLRHVRGEIANGERSKDVVLVLLGLQRWFGVWFEME